MAGKLLVISSRTEDVLFAEELSREIKHDRVVTSDIKAIEALLVDEPQSFVFCEADDPKQFAKIAKAIAGRIPRYRVFIVTDNPLNEYPDLFTHAVFGHHIVRRFNPPADQVIGQIMQATLAARTAGIEQFFPSRPAPKVQKIEITKSSQKTAAVKAVQNFLIKMGIIERMATKIAQASDELLLNAIFDAPVQKDGTRYRRNGSRDTDFVIDGGGITLSFAEGDHYAAISVTDNFGSLAKEEIMFALKKDFQDRAYIVRPGSGGGGLGLNSIVQSGLSVILLTRPQLRTEAIILFPKARTYKEFKSSFSFFGVIGV
jgi:hypothetical protein